MTWAAGFGKGATFRDALEGALGEIRERLGEEPDLVLFFSTRSFPPGPLPGLPGSSLTAGARVHQVWKPGTGWTGAPALALLAASFPFPCLQALRFRKELLPSPDQPPAQWRRILGFHGPPPSVLLLLAGQGAFHLVPLLPGLQSAFPKTTLAGAVLGPAPERDRGGTLHLGESLRAGEALGLALDPPASMRVRVIKGYEPLGPAHKVTSLQGEYLEGLDGRPAGEILAREAGKAPPLRLSPLLAEVSSLPPDPWGGLSCGEARMVIRAGGRIRILTPGGVRKGQWIRFCLPAPEEAARQAAALSLSPPGGNPAEGCALLFACPSPPSENTRDPARILAERLQDRPFLGARSWAQVAALPGCGPLLLGQTQVLCEVGIKRDGKAREEGPGPA